MDSSPQSAPQLEALVARARAGDREALEAVLANVAPAIHRFGRRMCKNLHDADDVLQDTLLAVAQHLPEFEGRSSLSSWVFSLTRSACSHRRRGLKNRPPVSDEHLVEEASPSPSPEAHASAQELVQTLNSALEALSDDYREVLLLRDVEGLSAPETAVALGLSVDAVKSRLHRAREALRTTLRPVLEPDETSKRTSCPDVGTLWSRKLEGELSPDDCTAMEKHLEQCPTCGAACSALKQTLLACQHVRTETVPPELQERVKSALRAWSAKV